MAAEAPFVESIAAQSGLGALLSSRRVFGECAMASGALHHRVIAQGAS